MARKTQEEWEAIIDAKVEAAGQSSSPTDEYMQFRDTAVALAMETELIQEQTLAMIVYNNANKQPISLPWYPAMIKEFQNGDSLLINTFGELYYAVIDEDKQIVKVCSVTETEDGSQLNIKVAKDDGAGELTQLSGGEQTNLEAYLDARMPPQVDYELFNLPADVVKSIITVRFDARYNPTQIEDAVNAARVSFRDNLNFNAIFYKSQLIEKIEAVEGVESVVLRIDMELNDGNTVITDLVEYQELPAGYFNWDDDSTLTKIAI